MISCAHGMQVMEAAVIAVPHPKWTERPLLVVVPQPKSNLSKDDMLKFLQVHHLPLLCDFIMNESTSLHSLHRCYL